LEPIGPETLYRTSFAPETNASAQRTRTPSNENARKSTKPIVILPLIAVWLQVQVLPGPPFLLEKFFDFFHEYAQVLTQ
jgi:hypothetical protein